MKFTKILALLLVLAVGVCFAGCVSNSGSDTPANETEITPADDTNASSEPTIVGTWEGYDRNGKMQLVFSDDGTVVVNYRDNPSIKKTWKLEDEIYKIYDDDGYNSANAKFQSFDTIQYTTSGAVLYTLTKVNWNEIEESDN